jgi:hypothetical protein
MDPILLLAVFSGVILLTVGWRLFNPAPRLEIGERGILDRSLGLGWIRWEEIEGVYQRRALEQDSVFLRLRPTERILRRIRRREDVATTGPVQPFDVRLDLADTGLSPVELVQEIMAHGAVEPASPTS